MRIPDPIPVDALGPHGPYRARSRQPIYDVTGAIMGEMSLGRSARSTTNTTNGVRAVLAFGGARVTSSRFWLPGIILRFTRDGCRRSLSATA